MKFHSDLKTVIISMVVLLLFFFSSLFIIAELNLTSPTLIVTTKILDDFKDKDGDISIEFSSLERNFRDRVMVNDLSLRFKGHEVAILDSVEIKLGLLDLISYFIRGTATPTIVVSKGELSIPLSLFSSEDNSNEGGEKPLSFETKYKFNVSILDLDLYVDDFLSIPDVDCYLHFGGLDDFSVKLSSPLAEYRNDGERVILNCLSVIADSKDGVKASLSFDSLECEIMGVSASTGGTDINISLSALDNLESISGELNSKAISYSAFGYEGKSELLKVSRSRGENIMTLSNTTLSNDEIGVRAGELSLETKDFDDYSIALDSLFLSYDSLNGYVEELSLSPLTLSERRGKMDIDRVTVNGLGPYSASQLSSFIAEHLKLSLSLSDKTEGEISFDSRLVATNPILSDLELGLDASLSIFDGKLDEYRISGKNLYLGYGERYENSISLSGNDEELSLLLTYGESVIDLTATISDRAVKGRLESGNYKTGDILPFLGESASLLSPFVSKDSLASMSLNLDARYIESSFIPLSGNFDYSIKVTDVSGAGVESDISLDGSLSFSEDEVVFSPLILDTRFANLTLDGRFGYEYMLPEFSFALSGSDRKDYASGSFLLGERDSYRYSIISPILSDYTMDGDLSFSEGVFRGENTLVTTSSVRPFSFSLDTVGKSFRINSSKLSFSLDFLEGISSSLVLTELDMVRNSLGTPMVVDSDIFFSLTEEGWSVRGSSLRLSDIWLFPSSPDISLSFSGSKDGVFVDSIVFSSDERVFFTGKGNLDFGTNALTLALDEDGGGGDMVFSFYKSDAITGLVRADNLDLTPFGLSDMYLNLNLTGRASRLEDLSLEGRLNVLPSDTLNDDSRISAGIVLTSDSLTLDGIKYTSGGLDVEIDGVEWLSKEGKVEINEGKVFMTLHNDDRDYPISAAFSLLASSEKNDSIYNSIFNMIREGGLGFTFDFNLDFLDIDNSRIYVGEKYTSGIIQDRTIKMDGTLLCGDYSLDEGTFSVRLDMLPLLKLSAFGEMKDEINAVARVDSFNMYVISLFMKKPLITFDESFVQGEVGIRGSDGIFSMSGNLWADELGVNIFWIPDQKLIMHNPRFTVWENNVISSLTKATVLNVKTLERKTIDAYAGLKLSPNLAVEGYVAEMWMDEDNPITIRLPLPDANIDVIGNGYGHYYMAINEGLPMDNDGELFLSDTTVSIGMNPYPAWYELKGTSNIDMGVNFLRNNKIIYPAGDNPIISITLDEDSFVKVYYSGDEISVNGDIDIRGGEVFYFQKYFYITEGNITFPDPTVLNPMVNLRATLRDYDSDSNRVEIYLVLKDNSFDNISPTLESSPAKDLTEIMEILGQNILPSSTYGTISVGSVTSLVTEGLDILSRLGIVTTANPLSGLSSSLKTVFGVDSFSLHSNIVNNILTDTITSSLTDTYSNLSPMARFLDGTTLNIGKYLSSSFYLQGMVHLAAATDVKDKYTFISDDLVLDTEFSLEWMNPAFKITFTTSPSYFSFYSLLDTFKFSISKTINW